MTSTRPEATVSRRGIFTGPQRVPTIGLVLVITLLAFEALAVGTVMPVTARDLDGLPLYAWGFSSFLIACLLANVTAGIWSDRVGPGRPLFTGLVIFVTGLVIAGIAPNMWVFVAGRSVQGVGAGATTVAVYVLAARVYPEASRPRLFAVLSAAWIVPSLVGPTIAGSVAEYLSWRAVFLGLIPLVVPAVVMLTPTLRTSGDHGSAPRRDRCAEADQCGRRDGRARGFAAVMLAAGAGAVLFAIDNVGWAILPAAVAGLACLGFGLLRLLPTGALLLHRGLPTTIAMRGLLSAAYFGTEAFIPLALTSVHGFTPTKSGIILTLGSLGWSAGAWYQSRSVHSHIAVGTVLMVTGIIGIAVATPLYGWFAAPAWVVTGGGMGLAYSRTSVLMLDLSAPGEQGANSAALQISDTLGGALGIGIAGALVTGFGGDRLELGLGLAEALTAAIALIAVFAAFRVPEATTQRGRGGSGR